MMLHEHHGLHEIGHVVSGLDLPESVRKDIMAIYQLIAEAESKVHGRPVEQVHFHDDRVIIGASQKKPSKIKGLQMILSYYFLQ